MRKYKQGMLEEKKVSVKFFLNTKLKGENFKGVMFYPLYARINFLENNTNIRVNRRSGQAIMMNSVEFDDFVEILESGRYPVEMLYSKGTRHVLNRKELIEKSVLWHYHRLGNNFSFAVFTKEYKRCEQDIWHLIQKTFVEKAKVLAYNTIESIDDFQSIDFEQIVYSDLVLNSWIDLIGGHKKLDSELLDLAGCLHALSYFNNYLFNVVLKYEPTQSAYPSERSTVFSWENGSDQSEFVDLTKKGIKSFNQPYIISSSWMAKSFLETFPVDGKRLEAYREKINLACKSLIIN